MDAGTQYEVAPTAGFFGLQYSDPEAAAVVTMGLGMMAWVVTRWWIGRRDYCQRRTGNPGVVWKHGTVHCIGDLLDSQPAFEPIYIPTPTVGNACVCSPEADTYEPAPSKTVGGPAVLPEDDGDFPGLSGLLGEWARANGEWIGLSVFLVLLLGTYGVFFRAMILSATPWVPVADTLWTDALCASIQSCAHSVKGQRAFDNAGDTNTCTDLVPWAVVGLRELAEAAWNALVPTGASGDSEASFLAAWADLLANDAVNRAFFRCWAMTLRVTVEVASAFVADEEVSGDSEPLLSASEVLGEAYDAPTCTDLVPWVVVNLLERVEAARADETVSEAPGQTEVPFLAVEKVRRVCRVALPPGRVYLRKEIARVYAEDDAEREVGAGEVVEQTIPLNTTKLLKYMLEDDEVEKNRIRRRGMTENRDFAKRVEKREELRRRAHEINSATESEFVWAASRAIGPDFS
jgi:hypothetical protein